MRAVSLIFDEQPELTVAFKRDTALLVESIMNLLHSVEFLLARRGDLEDHILSVIRKVQVKNGMADKDVCITFVSESPLAVCRWGNVCVDRVEFFQCTGRKSCYQVLSPLHRYMVERSAFVLCCTAARSDALQPLMQYASRIRVPVFNLLKNEEADAFLRSLYL